MVRGDLPQLLTWVDRYGPTGATLVDQPEAIWDHTRSQVHQDDDGTWDVVLPLWTAQEGPSDLSVEIDVSADGATARIRDLHVL